MRVFRNRNRVSVDVVFRANRQIASVGVRRRKKNIWRHLYRLNASRVRYSNGRPSRKEQRLSFQVCITILTQWVYTLHRLRVLARLDGICYDRRTTIFLLTSISPELSDCTFWCFQFTNVSMITIYLLHVGNRVILLAGGLPRYIAFHTRL